MSKSGVFAHFGSREELQISVIREYHERFEEEVFFPAMREPRGLPRLRALFERWVRRVSVEIDSGCIYISGAVEFDDRPGPVRDALAQMVRAWHGALERAIRMAIEEGHLRADTDPQQMLFEIHGLILALHHDARFLRCPARWTARAWLRAHAVTPLQPGARAPNAARTASREPRKPTEPSPAISASPLQEFQPPMPHYTPPLRDMQFVLHELLNVVDELKLLPRHADIDADTINAVLEEGGKFAAEVLFPLNQQRRRAGLHARQGHARGHHARRASRRPTRSTSKAAGRRCRPTRHTAARACRSC